MATVLFCANKKEVRSEQNGRHRLILCQFQMPIVGFRITKNSQSYVLIIFGTLNLLT